MSTVMIFGTFDLLHNGHMYVIKKALSLGDRLIIIVGRDVNIQKMKGEFPHWNEKKRAYVLKKTFHDSNIQVKLGNLKNFYKPIQTFSPDIIALGYDQQCDEIKLRNDLLSLGLQPKIIRLKSHKPHIYKTSILKKQKST